MATTYEKTDNLGLNLYGDNDPADLRDGYNDSMQTLDTDVKQAIDKADNAQTTADKNTTNIQTINNTLPTKISKVAHDDTLKGDGTTTSTLKVNLNHTTIMRDTGNTVYPTLLKAQTGATINGIGFNAGDGLTAFNTEDEDTGSGIRLSDYIQTTIENSVQKAKNIVWFGDSFAYVPEANPIPKYVANDLGATNYIYATSGSGYADLPTQAANASKNINDKTIIDTVIIMTGTNDFYKSITASDMLTYFSAVKIFPNARYIFVPTPRFQTATTYEAYTNAMNACYYRQIDVFKNSLWGWFKNKGIWNDVHLTEQGARWAALSIEQYLLYNESNPFDDIILEDVFSWKISAGNMAFGTGHTITDSLKTTVKLGYRTLDVGFTFYNLGGVSGTDYTTQNPYIEATMNTGVYGTVGSVATQISYGTLWLYGQLGTIVMGKGWNKVQFQFAKGTPLQTDADKRTGIAQGSLHINF